MASDPCTLPVCSKEDEINMIYEAICGTPKERGLAEKFRSHCEASDRQTERLSTIEKDLYGNGAPGLRHDVRRIKTTLNIVAWVMVILLIAILQGIGQDLWELFKHRLADPVVLSSIFEYRN